MRKTWIIFMLILIVLGIGTGVFLCKGQDTATKEIEQKVRNPKTGEPMPIKAKRVPVFRAGSTLRDQVNQKK